MYIRTNNNSLLHNYYQLDCAYCKYISSPSMLVILGQSRKTLYMNKNITL